MKNTVAICLFFFSTVLVSGAYALDFIWKDDSGARIYDCGGHAVGGRARIKALGDGTYRAKGVRINRIIRADSIYHAAQIVCGEKPEFAPAPQPKSE